MRPLRRLFLFLALFVLVAAGCGSGDDPSAAPAEAPTTIASTTTVPPTTVAPRPAVTLDSAGAQPRQPMALKLAAGSTFKVAMVNKLTMKMTVGGQAAPTGAVPATRLVISERIDKVDADGTGHFSFTFSDPSVVATPGVDPAVARATQAGIEPIAGVKGSGTIDPRGEVLRSIVRFWTSVTFSAPSVMVRFPSPVPLTELLVGRRRVRSPETCPVLETVNLVTVAWAPAGRLGIAAGPVAATASWVWSSS